MNSVIEAQEEFSKSFGELTLRHLYEGIVLPDFSREKMELDQFIDDHAEAKGGVPVHINVYKGYQQTVYKAE